MDIEREFTETDFSPLSSIKESLFERLLKERKKRVELFEDDLDFLAAAGSRTKNLKNENNSTSNAR